MAEATCRRELELEIPAEEVTKKIESVGQIYICQWPGGCRRVGVLAQYSMSGFGIDIT